MAFSFGAQWQALPMVALFMSLLGFPTEGSLGLRRVTQSGLESTVGAWKVPSEWKFEK
jgi:hypothetical protein